MEAQYGVFQWHPNSRYRLSEAVKTFVRETSADKHADKLNNSLRQLELGYVVRTLSLCVDA